jgi:hypothetical protein
MLVGVIRLERTTTSTPCQEGREYKAQTDNSINMILQVLKRFNSVNQRKKLNVLRVVDPHSDDTC